MTDKSKEISGQLFFRDVSKEASKVVAPERRFMIVVGILAIPNDIEIKGEHQYVVAGGRPRRSLGPDDSFIELGLFTDKGVVDRTELARGESIGKLLQLRIWGY